jgi:mRNA-degrading endonuclease RelE of RelBE toxin-antitoxin system
MDKIKKVLEKLTAKERKKIKGILIEIKNHRFKGLDIKKLKGRDDIFRVRKGQIRVVYRIDEKGGVFILTIERRNDTTYKK